MIKLNFIDWIRNLGDQCPARVREGDSRDPSWCEHCLTAPSQRPANTNLSKSKSNFIRTISHHQGDFPSWGWFSIFRMICQHAGWFFIIRVTFHLQDDFPTCRVIFHHQGDFPSCRVIWPLEWWERHWPGGQDGTSWAIHIARQPSWTSKKKTLNFNLKKTMAEMTRASGHACTLRHMIVAAFSCIVSVLAILSDCGVCWVKIEQVAAGDLVRCMVT